MLLLGLGAAGCGSLARTPPPPAIEAGVAQGFVFRDDDRDGVRDAGEKGISGVRVSNGAQVVLSDSDGHWMLPIDDDGHVFVVKPTGMMTALDERFLPRFYYLHKPAGSPTQMLFPGVPPTGALPPSIDFPLTPQSEPKRFEVLLVGDPQPYDARELGYFARDVVAELADVDAAFGVSLGDLVGDDLALFDPITQLMSLVGIPWYNVIGNHDINYDAPDDARSDETFERVFGPPSYAFEYANVHFVLLDNVRYFPRTPERDAPPRYTGEISERQLDFLASYLATVPEHERVVILMHIPIVESDGRCGPQCDSLLPILAQHPHTLSVSGHTHIQGHHFIEFETGNGTVTHHHWNGGAASGSWWRGAPDPRGVPHATMPDGAPNGYSIATFEGSDYAIRFKAASQPADLQMNIDAPEHVRSDRPQPTPVFANVFAGSDRSRVEMRLVHAYDGVSEPEPRWTAMRRRHAVDPSYRALREREGFDAEGLPRWRMQRPVASSHLWSAALPASLAPGPYWIEVRSTDVFGKVDRDRRALLVVPNDG